LNSDKLKTVSEVYHSGGTMLYPSDTLWALGCDPRNEPAVQKIIALKQRSKGKSFIVLLSNAAHIEQYVKDVPGVAFDLIDFAEDPITIVLENASHVAPSVLGPNGSLAVRVVKDGFCHKLINELRGPLLSTSANLSGARAAVGFEDIDPTITAATDFVFPRQTVARMTGKASTIVRIDLNGTFSFLRR